MSHRKPLNVAPPTPAAPLAVADLPQFVPAGAVAKKAQGAPAGNANAANKLDTKSSLKFAPGLPEHTEVEHAIANLVPGDPDRFHRVVRAIDAASPSQPTSGRRRRTSGVIQ